ncbi:MAG: glycosyltransferase family 2 protein [Gammaproteobacteria bacterium]|jgi:hypothetical protein
MTNRKLVTTVTVSYQSRSTIGQFLASMKPSAESGLADVVIVDNASSDGTADYVEKAFPWATLIRSDENLGFGRGCNRGFQAVKTPYVLFINPDASIEHEELKKLVDFMESHPSAGIAGPAIEIAGSTEFQPLGMLLTPMGLIRSALRVANPIPSRRILKTGEAPYKTNWICGAVMLVRSELFERLNGFDPRFFLYFEETDLCLRVLRSGMDIWAVGEATASHMGGVSAKQAESDLTEPGIGGCIVEYFYTSRFYYLVKNYGWFSAIASETIARCSELARLTAKVLLRRERDSELSPNRPFLRMPKQIAHGASLRGVEEFQ